MAKNITDKHITEYKNILDKKGEDGFYRHVVAVGIKQSITIKNPENDLIQLSEAFFLLNRQTGENLYHTLGKLLRRAAHKLYRQFNKEETTKISKKFLRAV